MPHLVSCVQACRLATVEMFECATTSDCSCGNSVKEGSSSTMQLRLHASTCSFCHDAISVIAAPPSHIRMSVCYLYASKCTCDRMHYCVLRCAGKPQRSHLLKPVPLVPPQPLLQLIALVCITLIEQHIVHREIGARIENTHLLRPCSTAKGHVILPRTTPLRSMPVSEGI